MMLEKDKPLKTYEVTYRFKGAIKNDIRVDDIQAANNTSARSTFRKNNPNVIIDSVKEKKSEKSEKQEEQQHKLVVDNRLPAYNKYHAEIDEFEKDKVIMPDKRTVYADDYRKLCKCVKDIDESYGKARELYLVIGCALYKINQYELYKICGFDNIYEFADEEYGIARGTTNEYINIVSKFCRIGTEENSVDPIPELRPEFVQYSPSQLAILQRYDSEEYKQIYNSSLSTRAMKRIAKEIKENKKVERKSSENDVKWFYFVDDYSDVDSASDTKESRYRIKAKTMKEASEQMKAWGYRYRVSSPVCELRCTEEDYQIVTGPKIKDKDKKVETTHIDTVPPVDDSHIETVFEMTSSLLHWLINMAGIGIEGCGYTAEQCEKYEMLQEVKTGDTIRIVPDE